MPPPKQWSNADRVRLELLLSEEPVVMSDFLLTGNFDALEPEAIVPQPMVTELGGQDEEESVGTPLNEDFPRRTRSSEPVFSDPPLSEEDEFELLDVHNDSDSNPVTGQTLVASLGLLEDSMISGGDASFGDDDVSAYSEVQRNQQKSPSSKKPLDKKRLLRAAETHVKRVKESARVAQLNKPPLSQPKVSKHHKKKRSDSELITQSSHSHSSSAYARQPLVHNSFDRTQPAAVDPLLLYDLPEQSVADTSEKDEPTARELTDDYDGASASMQEDNATDEMFLLSNSEEPYSGDDSNIVKREHLTLQARRRRAQQHKESKDKEVNKAMLSPEAARRAAEWDMVVSTIKAERTKHAVQRQAFHKSLSEISTKCREKEREMRYFQVDGQDAPAAIDGLLQRMLGIRDTLTYEYFFFSLKGLVHLRRMRLQLLDEIHSTQQQRAQQLAFKCWRDFTTESSAHSRDLARRLAEFHGKRTRSLQAMAFSRWGLGLGFPVVLRQEEKLALRFSDLRLESSVFVAWRHRVARETVLRYKTMLKSKLPIPQSRPPLARFCAIQLPDGPPNHDTSRQALFKIDTVLYTQRTTITILRTFVKKLKLNLRVANADATTASFQHACTVMAQQQQLQEEKQEHNVSESKHASSPEKQTNVFKLATSSPRGRTPIHPSVRNSSSFRQSEQTEDSNDQAREGKKPAVDVDSEPVREEKVTSSAQQQLSSASEADAVQAQYERQRKQVLAYLATKKHKQKAVAKPKKATDAPKSKKHRHSKRGNRGHAR